MHSHCARARIFHSANRRRWTQIEWIVTDCSKSFRSEKYPNRKCLICHLENSISLCVIFISANIGISNDALIDHIGINPGHEIIQKEFLWLNSALNWLICINENHEDAQNQPIERWCKMNQSASVDSFRWRNGMNQSSCGGVAATSVLTVYSILINLSPIQRSPRVAL